MARVYLDYNAATPMDPRVLEVYVDAIERCWANPSSFHQEGQYVKGLLSDARCRLAKVFNVAEGNIVFFSSATEALNTLIRGLLERKGKNLVTVATEHAAVLQCCRRLEQEGSSVTYVRVGADGAPHLADIEKNIGPHTSGIMCMAVNNETGVITDIQAIAALAQQYAIPFVVDAVAQLGKMPIPNIPGVSAFCCSSHKIYGPLGVGFAVVHNGIVFEPLLYGGAQENGRRAGTENVPAICATAYAVELAHQELEATMQSMAVLRDRFETALIRQLPGVHINGEGRRVATTSNLAFDNVDGEELLIHLDLAGIAASHGSACSAGSLELSHVLLQMGLSPQRVRSSVRFSFGKGISETDIEYAIEHIVRIVRSLRGS